MARLNRVDLFDQHVVAHTSDLNILSVGNMILLSFWIFLTVVLRNNQSCWNYKEKHHPKFFNISSLNDFQISQLSDSLVNFDVTSLFIQSPVPDYVVIMQDLQAHVGKLLVLILKCLTYTYFFFRKDLVLVRGHSKRCNLVLQSWPKQQSKSTTFRWFKTSGLKIITDSYMKIITMNNLKWIRFIVLKRKTGWVRIGLVTWMVRANLILYVDRSSIPWRKLTKVL